MGSIESKDSAASQAAAKARIAALPLAELNPADPQGFVDDTVGYTLARLRREDPVHRSHSPIPGIGTFWSVSCYADIVRVESDHAVYSSEDGITLLDYPPGDEQKLTMFIAMDPPRHDEQRQSVNPIVIPANLNNWRPLIRERTRRLLDSLPRNETFNWVEKVSVELTTSMLATLFDFPLEDRRLLSHWSDMVTANKLLNPDAPEPEVRMAELRKMLEYFTRLWNARLNQPPRTDLISMLALGPATRNMGPAEFMGNLALLIVGGNDTTRNSMTGKRWRSCVPIRLWSRAWYPKSFGGKHRSPTCAARPGQMRNWGESSSGRAISWRCGIYLGTVMSPSFETPTALSSIANGRVNIYLSAMVSTAVSEIGLPKCS
jgi:cytochrome P450